MICWFVVGNLVRFFYLLIFDEEVVGLVVVLKMGIY